jgi:hypothetical protein
VISSVLHVVHDLHLPGTAAAIDAADGGTMKLGLALVGILLLAATSPTGAGERMILKVTPRCRIRSSQPRRPRRRRSRRRQPGDCRLAESDDFYRSSEIQLDGDHAPRTNTFEFRSLPPGHYSVKAMLMGRSSEPRLTLRQQVDVMASGAGR